MAKDNSNTLQKHVLLNEEVTIGGLTDNLMGGIHMSAMEPLRLEAIKNQAENVESMANRGLNCLGVILAVAATTGDLEKSDVMNAGWTVQFLAEIAEMASLHSSNAQLYLDDLKNEAVHEPA